MRKILRKYQENLLVTAVCFVLIMAVIIPSVLTSDNMSREAVKTADKEAAKAYQAVPRIALTFDDGPCAGSTNVLLDGLQERGVKVTFFVIGVYAEQNPELIERMDAEGHLIGNHTYHHVDIGDLSDAAAIKELEVNSNLIESITGKPMEFVRPPFGVWHENLEREMEVIPVMWTVDPLDWTTNNVDEIVNKVVTKTGDGDIILLHDCYETSVAAALRIIDLLTAEGYEFVTVDEIILD